MIALRLESVTRRFGGVAALTDVSLEIEGGARHVILGPNGAGKTTLFRVISGEIPVSAGRVYLFGTDITAMPPWRRSHLGLGRTFQVTSLFPELSLLENVMLAVQARDRSRLSFLRPWHRGGPPMRKAEALLRRYGFEHRTDKPVGNLPHGEQRILEIVMALAGDPQVLLLDEPTAGVSEADAAILVDHLLELPPHITIVLVEHDLDVAFRMADTATVMADGRVFAHGSVHSLRQSKAVQELYLGRHESTQGPGSP